MIVTGPRSSRAGTPPVPSPAPEVRVLLPEASPLGAPQLCLIDILIS
jgi:hypothetical protein